jgi:hypothetical protein
MALTNTEIRHSKPAQKPYKLADSGGLHLLVTPAGGRLWRWKYRFEGTEKQLTLGQYPEVPLALARERHAGARAQLASGVDPMEQRKAEKMAQRAAAENSFQTIAGLWWEHWRVGKSPRHADMTRRRLEQNVFPALGARPIAEIEAPELVAMVQAIDAGRGRSGQTGAGNGWASLPFRHCERPRHKAQSRYRCETRRRAEANGKNQHGKD